jgi:hypothetical protein
VSVTSTEASVVDVLRSDKKLVLKFTRFCNHIGADTGQEARSIAGQETGAAVARLRNHIAPLLDSLNRDRWSCFEPERHHWHL